MEDIFSIGEVSRLLEVPAATIRFWEQEGHNAPCISKNMRKTGENPKKPPLLWPKNDLGRPLVDRPLKQEK